jgi:hypothetical protein
MILIKATPAAKTGPEPAGGEVEAMRRYNEELAGAGVLLAADGLQPRSNGARVRFDHGRPTPIDSPLDDGTDLLAGYWIWQVRSLDEAVEWLKRAPLAAGTEAEIRTVADPDDANHTNQTHRTGAAT